jgi:glycerol-3-phosphate dehydrogenase (NAD(P)+)
MGDLILTTTGGLSRNKQFGLEIAKGRKASEILASQRKTVEGYKTTAAAMKLAKKYEIRASIINALYEVLYNDKDPKTALKEMMALPAKFEDA